MPYLRFIALLTLSAFMLGLSSFGSATRMVREGSSPARIEKQKLFHLVALARVEQVKSIASQDDDSGKTPINWLPFAMPVLKTTWRLTALSPALHVPRIAPSLTGIVVLQI